MKYLKGGRGEKCQEITILGNHFASKDTVILKPYLF